MKLLDTWASLSKRSKIIVTGLTLFVGCSIYKKATTITPTLIFSNVEEAQLINQKTFLIKGQVTPVDAILYLDSASQKIPIQNGSFQYEALLLDSLNKINFTVEYKGTKANKSLTIIRQLSAQELAQRKKELEEKLEQENRAKFALERSKLIEKQFSFYDGSHYNLEKAIKASMNDPASYEHKKTTYTDLGDFILVRTVFRGKNAFGATIVNTVSAKVDFKGNVVSILE